MMGEKNREAGTAAILDTRIDKFGVANTAEEIVKLGDKAAKLIDPPEPRGPAPAAAPRRIGIPYRPITQSPATPARRG